MAKAPRNKKIATTPEPAPKLTAKGKPLKKRGRTNANNLKNGSRMTRLVLGNLPPNMWRISKEAREYRRMLEEAVMKEYGAISQEQHHIIDEAATAEQHAGVCRWLMRNRLETMSVGDISRCSEQIVKSKTARNKAVRLLKLAHDQGQDIIARLYSGEEEIA